MVCRATSQRMFGTASGFSGSQAWVTNSANTSTPSTRLLARNAPA